jgi:hypothetical protein
MVDSKPILFSLSTINDYLPTVSNSPLRRDQDLTIHEDDWRQFEAVSQEYDEAINAELGDIRLIYEKKSKQAGEYRLFTEIHVRKRIPAPFSRSLNWTDFISACGVSETAAVNVGFSDSQGVIEGGFAIWVGEITFYGIRDSQGIRTLCLTPMHRPNLTHEQAQHISEYLAEHRLVLIHWLSARVVREKDMLSYFEQE